MDRVLIVRLVMAFVALMWCGAIAATLRLWRDDHEL